MCVIDYQKAIEEGKETKKKKVQNQGEDEEYKKQTTIRH